MRRLLFTIAIIILLTPCAFGQDGHLSEHPNRRRLTRGWQYRWFGPEFQDAKLGFLWQKDFQGECVFIDGNIVALETDKYGDLLFFEHGDSTRFTPSEEAMRVGAKMRVRCDIYHNVRWLEIVPYHVWLRRQPASVVLGH